MAAYKQEFPETEKEGIFSFLKGKVPKFELLSLQTRLLVWGDRGRRRRRRKGGGNYADHGRGEEPSNEERVSPIFFDLK